jgi:predicted glutamine amidotransferase
MCRLYGFRANEATKVECTLAYAQNALLLQSRADRRGKAHADGWGIGYYPNGGPTVESRNTAAFADIHFSVTAERVYSCTVVAHVRRATVGAAALENTHPFQHGPWVFAHNGTVSGFNKLRRGLEEETGPALLVHRKGTTDSELVFYWLLSRLARAGVQAEQRGHDPAALAAVVREGVEVLDARCREASPNRIPRLNFLLTDGENLIATRWNHSLYWVLRRGIHDCEICGIPHVHHRSGTGYRAVVVASEPISHESWQAVPERSVLSVDRDINVQFEPIAPASPKVG